ncbi:hypothetical protein GCM10023264_12070 [Sphingomonas daechungensis]|uniref:DUF2384 domain-containing protein n=1 Tax=Sphingomonas daechungensis TaxID=1176646 RepID=A0ABX6SYI7_9SPHN|nr:hypothetical protein [Sphingomonas daechungensis]QNP42369.1 hypothetical protein H9L15_08545 [Sphingomonas daechungensis]
MAEKNAANDGKLPAKITQVFRKSAQGVRFTPIQSGRQNELIRSAWQSLSSKGAVIAFLNTANDKIGGRPLTLALQSDDGLRLAQRLLLDAERGTLK